MTKVLPWKTNRFEDLLNKGILPLLVALVFCLNPACTQKKKLASSSTTPTGSLPTTATPPTIPPPTVTDPTTSVTYGNIATKTISGTCLSGATVKLTGSATDSTKCASGSFSFSVTASAPGIQRYSLTQGPTSTSSTTSTDDTTSPSASTTSGTSAAVVIDYVYDITAPNTPVVVSPSTTTKTTNQSSLTISGTCETGANVQLSGNSSATTTCAQSAFSFAVNNTVDGTYSYLISQTDLAGNTSSSVAQTWIRDTSVSNLTITTPNISPYFSSVKTIILSGACESDAIVTLSGDIFSAEILTPAGISSLLCVNSTYAFYIGKVNNGTYNLSLQQKDVAGNISATVNQIWITNAAVPSAPTITTPGISPYYTSSSNINIAGSCITGNTVELSGSSSQTTSCVSSAYSFSVPKNVDQTYTFNVRQLSSTQVASSTVSQIWIRDTFVAIPQITAPSSTGTFTSADSTILIQGTCEIGSTVILGGAGGDTTACILGVFSLSYSSFIDGTYQLPITQVDLAGNISSSAPFSWTRNTVPPTNPTITSPGSSPYNSNTNSITIAGGCASGNMVTLSGGSSQTTSCVAGAYSFNVSKGADGTYNFAVSQTNTTNNLTSGQTTLSWVRDTLAPAAPTATNPVSNPFSSSDTSIALIGGCETGTTVVLTGDDSQTLQCTQSSYSFTINESSIGTYYYSLNSTDLAGNISGATQFTWQKTSSVPATPTITTPSVSPYYTSNSSIDIAGSCTTGNTVELSGSSSQTTPCVSSAYSFSVPKNTDGTYTFNVQQLSSTQVASSSVSQVWIRDTFVDTPQITAPSSTGTFTSADSSILIQGTCEAGATVQLSGSSSATTTCTQSAFSFAVDNTSDGNYSYLISQTDLARNTSSSVAQTWVRDTTISSLTITTPNISPYLSSAKTMTLSGTCESDAMVTLSGDIFSEEILSPAGSVSQVCVNSVYSFSLGKNNNGTYNLSLQQTDAAGNTSATVNQVWTINATVPNAPTITTPAVSPYYTSSSTITIAGTCFTGNTVELSGSSSQTTSCASSAYSFSVPKNVDGSYTFNIRQLSSTQVASSTVSQVWIRDSIVAKPQITAPSATGTFTSTDLTVLIQGTCENGATVILSGDGSDTTACNSGVFSFNYSNAIDGTYQLPISQVDLAGNSSSPATFSWTRNTVAPPNPTITSPASSPYNSNTNSVTIAGGCVSGNTVTLSGGSSQTTSCVAGAYTFNASKAADGTYSFAVSQTSSANNLTSGQTTLSWVRDTLAPASPTISSPASNPFSSTGTSITLTGGCETGTTVVLSGGDSQTLQCSASNYSFVINKSSVGTYYFSLNSTDLAGNISNTTQFTWQKTSASVPATPTITSPAANPTYSNGNSVIVSGGCTAGLTVTLGGVSASTITNPAGSLTQTCNATLGTYSYTLSLRSDASYTFSVKQTDASMVDSASTSTTWVRDTIAPTATIGTRPSSPNYYATANFSLSSSEAGSSFICSSDNMTYTSCTNTPSLTFTNTTNGSKIFYAKAIDLAGNTGSAVSYTWTQSYYHTLGLYHFNVDGSDSSSYGNNLTGVNGPTYSLAKISAVTLSMTPKFLYKTHDTTQTLGNSTMTLEGWVKPTTSKFSDRTDRPAILISKTATSSSNLGWMLGVQKGNKGNTQMVFWGSLNGTTFTKINATTEVTANSGTWYHFAATFDKGTVKLYWNGSLVGSGTIGVAGTATLATSTADLAFGVNSLNGDHQDGNHAVFEYVDAAFDVVRISQIVRYSNNFTPSTSALSAD